MKIRNKITVVFLVFCMLLFVVVANAASHTVNYVKALTDDYVTISGTVVNGANREVLLRIDYAGHAPSADTDSLEQSVIYQKQTTFPFKTLLSETKLPVSEIASLCGFADYNYFSRVFKKKYGISPITIRKNR